MYLTRPILCMVLGLALPTFAGCGASADDDDSTFNAGSSPVAGITSITEGQVLYPGDSPWTFVGTVSDAETTDPRLLNASWSLTSGTEQIASGSPVPDANGQVTLQVSYLNEGDYLLTLNVTDPSGLQGTTQISFQMYNTPPVVQILAPTDGDGVNQDQPFTIAAHIADADNRSSGSYSVSLSDALGLVSTQLSDSEGGVSFQYVPAVAGTLELTLSATDELGGVGSTTLDLIVNACLDDDGDGYTTCPVGDVPGDCDDAEASVFPGAAEQCNGVDDDCDENIPAEELDADGDGVSGCKGDCNDNDATTYAGASEQCDGADNNCDKQLPAEEIDSDGDGYRPCGPAPMADCDDTNWGINPAANEICDGKDDNCDGVLPSDENDDDKDGWFVCAGDCNDADFYAYPGATERLDLKDNDCDGKAETSVRLSAAQARYDGIQQDAQTGLALSAGGDLNGDGIGDLAIGAPKHNSSGNTSGQRGAVFLVFGRSEGWNAQQGVSLAGLTVVGDTEPSALAGSAVSIASDLNGDKIDDLVIGAPGHTSSNATQAGAVYLIAGRKTWTSDSIENIPVTVVEGSSNNMNLGAALSGSGDINGDGLMDVAIGAPWPTRRTSQPGMVAVLSKPLLGWPAKTNINTLARIMGEDNASIGTALAIGSSTGDGYADLIMAGLNDPTILSGTAYWTPGSSSIRAGTQTTVTTLNAHHYDGDNNSERVGYFVGGGVDVDGDGNDDALVGRYSDGASGDAAAYLMFGASSVPTSGAIEKVAGVRFLRTGSDECPCSVTGIGDWNGDGLGDFAIAATRNSEGGSSAGKIYLFLGRKGRQAWPSTISLDEADGMAIGEAASDQAGYALAGGDLNKDGLADLVVAAPFGSGRDAEGNSVPRAGKVYVILGSGD